MTDIKKMRDMDNERQTKLMFLNCGGCTFQALDNNAIVQYKSEGGKYYISCGADCAFDCEVYNRIFSSRMYDERNIPRELMTHYYNIKKWNSAYYKEPCRIIRHSRNGNIMIQFSNAHTMITTINGVRKLREEKP